MISKIFSAVAVATLAGAWAGVPALSFIVNTTLGDAASSVLELVKNSKVFHGLVVCIVLCWGIVKFRKSSARSKFMASLKKQQKGQVYIYGPPRLLDDAPHMSMNVIKLEAFCRVNKVPYHMIYGMDFGSFSPTETVPFIAIDGELTGDSQFCIDAIQQKFQLGHELPPQEQAVSTLVRKTIEWSLSKHLYRTQMVDNAPVLFTFVKSKYGPLVGMPGFVIEFFLKRYRKTVISGLNGSGLGWYSDERYLLEATRDIQAIASLVQESQKKGNKYLFGHKPSSTDCLLYGSVVSVRAHAKNLTKNTAAVMALVSNPALVKFCQEFEAEFFADLKAIAPCGLITQSFVKS